MSTIENFTFRMSDHRRRRRHVLAVILLGVFLAASSQATIHEIVADPLDSEANCTAIVTTITGITGASQNDAHQIRLGPGNYKCTNQTIVMKEWVDIVGSGIETTLVQGTGAADTDAGGMNVLIRTADNAELRQMMVEMNNVTADSIGIFIYEAATRVDNVDVMLDNGSASCFAVLTHALSGVSGTNTPWRPVLRNGFFESRKCSDTYGVQIQGKTLPQIRRSYLMATAADGLSGHNVALRFYETDVQNGSDNIKIRDVEMGAYGTNGDSAECYAIEFSNIEKLFKTSFFAVKASADKCSQGNVALDNVGNSTKADRHVVFFDSHLKGTKGDLSTNDVGIEADGTKVFVKMYGGTIISQGPSIRATDSASVEVGSTHLKGTGVEGGSLVKCAGVYDENFDFFASSCP